MKKKSLAVFSAVLLLAACAEPYDDSSVRQDIQALQKKMEELEKSIGDINSEISSLRELVTAIQNGRQILDARQVAVDGETFWELVFSDNFVITIHNGKDGADGRDGKDGQDGYTPVIGVKQFTDGQWYWTLDGNWLLDGNGNKIRATAVDGKDGNDGQDGEDGKDGDTPQLKIEDGFWWVSYDNGQTWVKLKEYQESTPVDAGPIRDIDTTTDAHYVIVTLKNGEIINIPRYVKLTMAFGADEVATATPGATLEVPYTLTGGSDSNVVKAFGQGGWTASAEPSGPYAGIIKITAPETIVSCEVIVLASDGDGYTALASINCAKGEIRIASLSVEVPATGGDVEIPLQTNVDSYNVETDADWLYYLETRAFHNETVSLTAKANPSFDQRFASVIFKQEGNLITTVMVCQAGKELPQAYGIWATDVTPIYAYDPSVAQMNCYEAAGEVWFRFVEPSGIIVREVGPIPSGPVLKGSFPATFSVTRAGEQLSSEDITLTVRSIAQEKLILSTADDSFFVIRF